MRRAELVAVVVLILAVSVGVPAYLMLPAERDDRVKDAERRAAEAAREARQTSDAMLGEATETARMYELRRMRVEGPLSRSDAALLAELERRDAERRADRLSGPPR